ncbi:hypothetical protein K474DRAFT_979756 [Panus rudis PR-1116 ss-1]|nr:hypothetical protein K474DRAFT_979756 [Panus rudis PR-1116 ss-1]
MSPRREESVFPQEIYEEIIHWCSMWSFMGPSTLRNATLRACSLVCRAWYPYSQRRLVQEVYLHDPSVAGHRSTPIMSFVELLTRKTALQGNVLGLTLKVANDPTWVFHLIGPRLPSLRYLVIDITSTNGQTVVCHPTFYMTIVQYNSIRYFAFYQDGWIDTKKVLRVCRELPNITHLDARDGRAPFLPQTECPISLLSVPSSLRSLVLPGTYPTHASERTGSSLLVKALFNNPAILSRIERLWVPGTHNTGCLLRACHSLQELVVAYHDTMVAEVPHISLSHLHNLRELGIIRHVPTTDSEASKIMDLLESVSSSKLHTLDITFTTDRSDVWPRYIDVFTWGQLEGLLISRFPRCTLNFTLAHKGQREKLDLTGRLPRLAARGNLGYETRSGTAISLFWRDFVAQSTTSTLSENPKGPMQGPTTY